VFSYKLRVMKIIIKEYEYTYKAKLAEGVICEEFINHFLELASKIYHPESVEEHLKNLCDKS